MKTRTGGPVGKPDLPPVPSNSYYIIKAGYIGLGTLHNLCFEQSYATTVLALQPNGGTQAPRRVEKHTQTLFAEVINLLRK
jgi:hypothetical protein